MIGISMGSVDLSDSFLRRIVQLGVDCVDLGCPPLDGLPALKKRIRRSAWTSTACSCRT